MSDNKSNKSVNLSLILMVKGWKLVPCASLLALPMKPEEATNSQDNVRKASAVIWFHSTPWLLLPI